MKGVKKVISIFQRQRNLIILLAKWVYQLVYYNVRNVSFRLENESCLKNPI
jgi:hypothetical protein